MTHPTKLDLYTLSVCCSALEWFNDLSTQPLPADSLIARALSNHQFSNQTKKSEDMINLLKLINQLERFSHQQPPNELTILRLGN